MKRILIPLLIAVFAGLIAAATAITRKTHGA